MCYYPFFPGTDLPDDDYTTLVPQVKSINVKKQNLSQIPTIIETHVHDSTSSKKLSNKNISEQRKTTITAISRRSSTIEYDSVEYTRSAPPSPALNHNVKQRSTNDRISMYPIENEAKCVSNGRDSLSTNEANNSIFSGILEVRFKFDAKNSKMWVFIIKATLEITEQHISKTNLVQIHLTLLPSKRIRFRTRVKPIDNAIFAEEFFCKVLPETIQSHGIRFRIYSCERFKREKLLSEATIMFAMLNLDEDMCKIIPLERVYSSPDSDFGSRSHLSSSSYSRQNSIVPIGDGTINSVGPEIEIGLAYDKNQSILTLEVGKGNNFRMTSDGRAPDTYIQITLRNVIGEEIATNRTVTKYAQYQPIFAERYSFNIQENFLNQITFIISVVNKNSTSKNDRELGSISFGNDASGNAQVAHWDSMLNAESETITRWHALLEK